VAERVSVRRQGESAEPSASRVAGGAVANDGAGVELPVGRLVTADVIPASGSKVFSIVGPKLGCEIDAATGEVQIGSSTGSIKVCVSSGKGSNFDEVTITITALAPPQPQPTP